MKPLRPTDGGTVRQQAERHPSEDGSGNMVTAAGTAGHYPMPQFDAIDVGKLMRNVPPPTLLNAPCARRAHPENRRRRDAEIYVSFGPSATDLTTRRRRGVPSAAWRLTSFGTGAAAGVRAEAKTSCSGTWKPRARKRRGGWRVIAGPACRCSSTYSAMIV